MLARTRRASFGLALGCLGILCVDGAPVGVSAAHAQAAPPTQAPLSLPPPPRHLEIRVPPPAEPIPVAEPPEPERSRRAERESRRPCSHQLPGWFRPGGVVVAVTGAGLLIGGGVRYKQSEDSPDERSRIAVPLLTAGSLVLGFGVLFAIIGGPDKDCG